MTDFHIPITEHSPISAAARAAKAKRKAVLDRVRAQRAKAYTKKTVAGWMEVGVIIRGSELKKRYSL